MTELHRAIFDSLDIGVVIADASGVVTLTNRAAATLLAIADDARDLAVATLLGLPASPAELLDGASNRTMAHVVARASGGDLDLDLGIGRADGGAFFFLFRDVGEEKARAVERARFQHLAAMGTMVAGFAHEVRNPVAAMRSILEELDEDLGLAGQRPHLLVMMKMVERIEHLVRTALQFGRPAAPLRASQRPWVIASNAVSEVRARVRALGGEIQVDVEPDLPDVNVDERQIAQVLVILLQNALDATGSGSRVSLRVTGVPAPSEAVRFEVADDGPGIPVEIQQRIFDPFFTTKATGVGLGLSIAQQVVRENGARIELASNAGATLFAVIVPVEPR